MAPVTDTGTLGTAAVPEVDEDVEADDEDVALDDEDVTPDDEGAPPVSDPESWECEHAEDAAMAAGATRRAAPNVDRTQRALSSMPTSLGALAMQGAPTKVRLTAFVAKPGPLP